MKNLANKLIGKGKEIVYKRREKLRKYEEAYDASLLSGEGGTGIMRTIAPLGIGSGIVAGLGLFLTGCSGGSGGGASDDSNNNNNNNPPIVVPVADVEFVAQQTTDNSGKTVFVYDTKAGEDTGEARINTADENYNVAPNVLVELWHNPGNFELYAAKDLTGKLAFPLFPKPHNSEWDLTGVSFVDLKQNPIINIYLIGSQDFETTNKIVEEVESNVDYDHYTLSELESNLNSLFTGLIVSSDGDRIYNCVAEKFSDIVERVSDLAVSDNYMVFTGISGDASTQGILGSMVTIEHDRNKNGVRDRSETNFPTCTDKDGDGFSAEGGECGVKDCNDTDGRIYPNSVEIFDGVDNNCNGQIDEGFVDKDKDGFFDYEDCNDNNYSINPGANEICGDEIDNNCNGQIDEGCVEPIPSTGTIYFSSERSGMGQLWKIKPDGSNMTQLTFSNVDVSFNPVVFGNKIYHVSGKFITPENHLNPLEICVINSDGTGEAQVTNNNSYESQPTISKDGKIACVSNKYENFEICLANGEDIIRVTNHDNTDTDPAWFPNGNKLLFAREVLRNSNDYQIYSINSDGSGETKFISSAYSDRHASFSPDGNKILLERKISGSRQVFIADKDGKNLKQLTFESFNHYEPKWSPDGKGIVFYTDEYGGRELAKISSEGGDLEYVTLNGYNNWEPVWGN